MVDIDPEEWSRRKQQKLYPDPRNSRLWHSEARSAQILIPLVNIQAFRYHAERLRSLANHLDDLSREPLPEGMTHDDHERRRMREFQHYVRQCSKAINATPT